MSAPDERPHVGGGAGSRCQYGGDVLITEGGAKSSKSCFDGWHDVCPAEHGNVQPRKETRCLGRPGCTLDDEGPGGGDGHADSGNPCPGGFEGGRAWIRIDELFRQRKALERERSPHGRCFDH